MKHTPGPWTASFGNLFRVIAGGGYVICGVHKIGAQTGEYHRAEIEANVHLIASAPDMLAALRLAAISFGAMATAFDEENMTAMADLARKYQAETLAAITKATGEGK